MADELVVIDDEDELYKRVFPYHVVGDTRVSSAAFKDKRKPANKFSADCAKLTTPRDCLTGPHSLPNLRLICFVAQTPRSLDFAVWHDPELGNYAHCSIEGESTGDKCDILAEKSWPIQVVEQRDIAHK
jgi:hypothetical protein